MTKTGTGSARAEAVEHDLEVALPAVPRGVLLRGAEAAPDHRHVRRGKVGADHARLLAALDQLLDEAEQLALVTRHAPDQVGTHRVDLALGPVVAVEPGAAPHDPAERLPRVLDVLERLARDRADRLVAAERDRLDQRLLRREVAVDGAHAHPGPAGDVIHLSVQPVLREGLQRGRPHALGVAASVGSEWACGGGRQAEPCLRYSAETESEFRILPGSCSDLHPRIARRPSPLD